MDFSIITVTYNSANTINDCLASVAQQRGEVEHLIIDGASTDETVSIARRLSPKARVVSEPDCGIYDAMNKGLRIATGEVIGILNSDDLYIDGRVLEKVGAVMADPAVDGVFADLVYVRPNNLERVVRFYSGAQASPEGFAWGWMPPHPTFFVRRAVYEKYGLFRTDYEIAADYELMTRFLARYRIRCAYLPEVLVKMRTGGVSTRGMRSTWVLNREILRACRENGVNSNYLMIYSKYVRKSLQLFRRPA